MPHRLPEEQVISLYQAGKSYQQIADEVGASYAGVAKMLRRVGVQRRGRRRGPDHPRWKGGRKLTKHGYWRVWIDPSDPMAVMVPASEKASYVLEHRLIMARHIGRPLLPSEQVHHRNGDKEDNRVENLQLRIGPHGVGQCYACQECGSRNVAAVDI